MPEPLGEAGSGKGEGSFRVASYPSPPILTWHLYLEPCGRAGAENMAVDQALLDDVASGNDGTAYLRLYAWDPPCLSFGRHEPALTRYDREAIERLGVDVVRRPTGGRAVWHQHEVTYAVAAPIAAFGTLRSSYLAIHRRLAGALRSLGAHAGLAAPGERAPGPAAGPCFARPVGGEVMIAGRKVVGSAQVRQGHAFLQHGSILLDGSQDLVRKVSRRATAPVPATSLAVTLGRTVGFQEVTHAVREHWLRPAEEWATTPVVPSSPAAAAYADPAWTWRR